MAHWALHTDRYQSAATQPWTASDGALAMVMDGYIANRLELRDQLSAAGHRIAQQDDCSLLAAAYRQWGTSFVARLDGEFALVLWDKAEGHLLAARDHMGLRPLYYAVDGDRLILASELKAIIAMLPRQPDLDSGYWCEAVTRHWYSREDTIWTGIKRIAGGHCLLADRNGVNTRKYWDPPTRVTVRRSSEEEYVEEYREVLARSIAGCAHGVERLAIEVSGGLDSSGVYAVARHLKDEGRLTGTKLQGYSLAGAKGSTADELDYALAVADFWGDKLVTRPLTIPPLEEFTKRAIVDRTLPTYPNIVIAREMNEAMREDGFRVSLTGQGGDQWLDGVPAYHQDAIRGLRWKELTTALRADIRSLGRKEAFRQLRNQAFDLAKPDILRRLKRSLSKRPQQIYPANTDFLSEQAKQMLEQRRAAFFNGYSEFGPHYKQMKAEYPFLQLLFDQLSQHQATVGIEQRQPMLSRRFIEFSCNTPEYIRLRGGVRRWVHREALRELMPDRVLNRSDKAAFSFAFLLHYPEIFSLFNNRTGPQLFQFLFDRQQLDALIGKLCDVAPDDDPYLWQVWGWYALWTLGEFEELESCDE